MSLQVGCTQFSRVAVRHSLEFGSYTRIPEEGGADIVVVIEEWRVLFVSRQIAKLAKGSLTIWSSPCSDGCNAW